MNVLIIAAHPDDETLGCGGTIFKHINKGDSVSWLIVTNVQEAYGFSAERVSSRNEEIKKVASLYGFSDVYNLEFKPAGLTSENQSELINDISHIVSELKPDTIYLPNCTDAHSDHRYTFQAAFACTKPFRYPSVKKVLMYECISETEFSPALSQNAFVPNYFVAIDDFIDQKIAAIEIYASEVSAHPFPRSIENIKALATFRGASAGVMYAEAFCLLRHIEN